MDISNIFRTASCVTESRTILLEMDASPFKEFLADEVKQLSNLRIYLFSNLYLFQNWEKSKIGVLRTHTKVETHLANNYIYKKGDKNDNLYVVISGEVEIKSTGKTLHPIYFLKECIDHHSLTKLP